MADIVHQLPNKASSAQVFEAISTPTGLDARWTKRATGLPKDGAEYELRFGDDYVWRGHLVS